MGRAYRHGLGLHEVDAQFTRKMVPADHCVVLCGVGWKLDPPAVACMQVGWCYRLKQDFMFKYDALEDELRIDP